MRTLTGSWIEWFAAAMLAVTAVFSYSYGQYGTALIAGVCCGLVAGVLLGTWAARR
jgi:hypothetical protein